jgi:hypothetical protein
MVGAPFAGFTWRAARSAPPAPDDADAEEIEMRTTPAATYPVIWFGAFEAGDERRYR